MNLLKDLKVIASFKAIDDRHKSILLVAVAFLCAFFICYKLIYKNAVIKKTEYDNMARQEAARNDLRRDLQKIGSLKGDYQGLVLYTKDIDMVKNELSKLVVGAGGNILSIRSAKKSSPADYDVFSTIIELSCTYHQLGRLVADIESARPYIGIEYINVKNPDEYIRPYEGQGNPSEPDKSVKSGNVAITVSLTLETFLSK